MEMFFLCASRAPFKVKSYLHEQEELFDNLLERCLHQDNNNLLKVMHDSFKKISSTVGGGFKDKQLAF